MRSNRAWLSMSLLLPWLAAVSIPGAQIATGQEQENEKSGGIESVDPETLLPNGRHPLEGIVTGGQPSIDQLRLASEKGFRTVINLRTPDESPVGREAVEAAGMSYVSLPIAGAAALTEARAKEFALALEEAEGPLLVHCGAGNRVGALFALKAYYVDEATPEEALALGLDAGLTGLEAAVREHLGLTCD